MTDSLLREALDEARTVVQSLLADMAGASDVSTIDRFVHAYSAVGQLDSYRWVPGSAVSLIRPVLDRMGPDAERLFLRAALGQGIVLLIDSGKLLRLPSRILMHHAKQLKRIAGALGTDADWFRMSNDRFLKDMGIVTLRLLAAAAQLLDTHCGIPRSVITRQPLRAMPSVFLDLVTMGGFRPYIQIHTHLSYLDDFNEEGWNECYRCCAELCETRADLLGMFGSSWFYDPALAEISPRLNYLREVPQAGGAKLWFYEAGGDAIENALSTSSSRRKLFDEGKYMPKSYMLAWGRNPQRAWAARNPVIRQPS